MLFRSHDVAHPDNALAIERCEVRMSGHDVGRVIANGFTHRNCLDDREVATKAYTSVVLAAGSRVMRGASMWLEASTGVTAKGAANCAASSRARTRCTGWSCRFIGY